ncbi:MAG: MBL fold metallo-hydrolase [Pirellulaceae bacterium]
MRIRHINCGTLVVPTYPTIVCHCLLLQEGKHLVLVDTGIGLEDVRNPVKRLGQPLIDMAGFQFDESDTAVRRLQDAGFSPTDVRHIVITHGDPDHVGGLTDFPEAEVHVSADERAGIAGGHWRYVPTQFAHGPRWKTYERADRTWYGLAARRLDVGLSSEVLLVPLPGHTLGHCGVAIQQQDRWLLHAGDAYYLRIELTTDDHPVSLIAAQRADDDEQRRASLEQLRRLARDHAREIEMIGYHDLTELPST